jgi:hypothetical protein
MFGIFLLVVVYNKISPAIWECKILQLPLHSFFKTVLARSPLFENTVLSPNLSKLAPADIN